MGAALHDLAMIHDQDQVTITDGGKAVGHDQHGTISQLIVDHIEDGVFGTKIEAAGRFIKDIEVGIFQERASHRNALFLTTGEAVAGFFQISVVLQRQLADKLVGVCLFGGSLDLVDGRVRLGDPDVIIEGLAEKLHVLGHVGNRAADGLIAVLVQIDAIDVDLTAFRLIILEQEFGDRGFAAAALANQRHFLSFRDRKGHMIQGRGTAAVPERDIFELDVTIYLLHLGVFLIVFLLGFIVHDLRQTLHGNLCFLNRHLHADQVAHRRGEVAGKGAERHIAAQRHVAIQHLHDTHVRGDHAENGRDQSREQRLSGADLTGTNADLHTLDVFTLKSFQLAVLIGIAFDGLDAAEALDHLAVEDGRLLHRLFIDPLVGLLINNDKQQTQQKGEDRDGEEGRVHPEQDDAGGYRHHDIHDHTQRDAGEDGLDGGCVRITGGDLTSLPGGEELHGQFVHMPEVPQHQRDVDLDGQVNQDPLTDSTDQCTRDAHDAEHQDHRNK